MPTKAKSKKTAPTGKWVPPWVKKADNKKSIPKKKMGGGVKKKC